MYAVLETGGKQYRVAAGDTLEIERLPVDAGQSFTFDRVLLVAGEGSPRIGAPLVAGVTVTADVLGPVKGPKVTTVKYKRRKGYRKKIGHRQQYTAVKITGINVPGLQIVETAPAPAASA